MPKIIKNVNQKKEDRITEQLFKSSVNSFYAEEGVKLAVTSVSKVFTTKFSKDPNVAVQFEILSDLPKIRARVLDDDGKVVKTVDEVTGKETPKIELISSEDVSSFTSFLRLKTSKDEEFPIFVNSRSSAHPILAHAMGVSEEDNFATNEEELKEELSGLELTVSVEKRSFNGNGYLVLVPVEE